MKLSLSKPYAPERLLICGLSGAGTSELYKFIDLASGAVQEKAIDIARQRGAQLAHLEQHALAGALPYGHSELRQLLPYFMHPHSFLETPGGDVVVSFKQAPYLRVLGADGGSRLAWPAREGDFSRMVSSTNHCSGPHSVYLTLAHTADRLARYIGDDRTIRCELARHDLERGSTEIVQALPGFLLDSLHQVVCSPANFIVGVDMNLSVNLSEAWLRSSSGALAGDRLGDYCRQPFPKSLFFVFDPERGHTTIGEPSAACAAHVEVDPRDPSVFYVSCHNISKWQNQVVVHGSGAIDRYAYRQGRLTRLGSFSEPGFYRITSQKLFERDGRWLVAVTGFPNKLYLLDADSMCRVEAIELFEAESPRAPFVCSKNADAPLYIAVSADARYAFLTGASTLFVVDLIANSVVERLKFCEADSFLATAHIGLTSQPSA